jgi:hypothetical protein
MECDHPTRVRHSKRASAVAPHVRQTVGLFAFCRYIYFHLGPPEPGTRGVDSTWWNEIWSTTYTAAIVVAIVTISSAALIPEEKKPRLARWIATAAASVLTLLVCVAIYYLWL